MDGLVLAGAEGALAPLVDHVVGVVASVALRLLHADVAVGVFALSETREKLRISVSCDIASARSLVCRHIHKSRTVGKPVIFIFLFFFSREKSTFRNILKLLSQRNFRICIAHKP